MIRVFTTVAVAAIAAAASGGAASAQGACGTTGAFSQVQGTVLVDNGGGFSTARVGGSVASGARVTVQGAGGATVNFSGQLVSVGSSATSIVQPPGCGLPSSASTATPAAGQIAVTTAIIGAGVWAGVEISDNNNKTPFFPVSP